MKPGRMALLGAALLSLAVPSSGGLPTVSLDGLEPQVSSQLSDLRLLVEDGLARSGSDPAGQAALVGELGLHYQAYDLVVPAAECFRMAAELAPEDARWPYQLAYLHQRAGRIAEAGELYERSLEVAPDLAPAWFRLGEIYREVGRATEARRAFERSLEYEPSAAAAEAALGGMALDGGDPQEAIDRIERALDLAPDANLLYYPLALAYRERGEEEVARRLLLRRGTVGVRFRDPWIDDLPSLTRGARLHLLRGQAAYRANRFEEAVREFRAAVDADPGDAAGRVDLAAALAALDRPVEAEIALREALELQPEHSTAWFNLGRLLEHAGDVAGAEAAYGEAARRQADDAEIQLRWAAALAQLGRADEALPLYRRAVALAPAAEGARLGEAQCLVRLGRFSEAVSALEEAHRLLPRSGLVAEDLARLLSASPDLTLRNGSRAVDLASRIYAAQPSARSGFLLAAALAEAGRCTDAARLLERLLTEAGAESALEQEVSAEIRHYASGPPCRPRRLFEPSAPR